MPWTFQHSITCRVTPEFAWAFWTNVDNWALDADVVSVEIDGPFAPGAQGVTNSRSSGRIAWRIAQAQSGSAVIEFPLPGAVGRFTWTFEPADEGVRITQFCTIEGEFSEVFAAGVGPSLEAGIPAGMQKLGEAMERSFLAQERHGV